jgi:hypothetical protein
VNGDQLAFVDAIFSSGPAAVRRLPISANLRFRSEFSTPKGQEDSARGFNPGKFQSNARPERALDVRVGNRVYCKPKKFIIAR